MTVIAPEAFPPDRESPEVLKVIAGGAESLQDGLDRAVQLIRQAAPPGDSRGILVTRLSSSLFTVEASDKVPHGTTMESDRWNRQAAAAPTPTGDEETL